MEDSRFTKVLSTPGTERVGAAWDKELAAMAYHLPPRFIGTRAGMAEEGQRVLGRYPKLTSFGKAVEKLATFRYQDGEEL